ncbi:MAG: hypothetical protein ABI556_09930 [Gemmatimonadales bacterium]
MRLYPYVVSMLITIACGGDTSGPGPVDPEPIAGRWLQGMVYDEARSVLLVFGGSRINGTTGVFFNDLWSWNGTTWTQIATPTAPSARDEMLLVYDASRQRVVLHGGRDNTGSLTDTWEWDGTAWQQKATSGPPARKHAGGGYDRTRARTVLYGGQTPSDVVLTDTWEWDGSTWSQRATTRPSPLDAPTNPVFDAARNALVMLVGSFSSGPTEMWQWNGSAWASIGAGPTTSLPNSIAVIGPSNVLMYDTSGSTATTWQWNGATWSNLGVTSPARRFAASMGYDQGRSRIVLFGGSLGSAYVSETWTFASGAWSQVP